MENYSRAIELKPEAAEIYNNRANTYQQSGQFDLAIADYTKAIELRPGYLPAYSNRAVLYARGEQYAKAWADVEQVRKLGGTLHPQFVQELTKASGRSE